MLPTRGHLAPHTCRKEGHVRQNCSRSPRTPAAGVSALKVPAKVSDGLTFRNEFEDQHLGFGQHNYNLRIATFIYT